MLPHQGMCLTTGTPRLGHILPPRGLSMVLPSREHRSLISPATLELSSAISRVGLKSMAKKPSKIELTNEISETALSWAISCQIQNPDVKLMLITLSSLVTDASLKGRTNLGAISATTTMNLPLILRNLSALAKSKHIEYLVLPGNSVKFTLTPETPLEPGMRLTFTDGQIILDSSNLSSPETSPKNP